jgi:hypothetical protein
VRAKPAPDKPGFFETDAVGGLTEVAMKNAACQDGYLGGRDVYFKPSPPPAPAAAPNYYVVDDGAGGLTVAYYNDTPPQDPDSGPYDNYADALAASGGAGRTPLALNIATVGTADGDVGTTQTVTFNQAFGSGGPYTWTLGFADPGVATINSGSSDTHTGSSYSPQIDLLTSGSFSLNIELKDAATGDVVNFVPTYTASPPEFAVLTVNTDIDDSFSQRLTRVDTGLGAVSLAFQIAAANRGWQRFTFKNEAGANNVTIVPFGSDTINGGASYTLTPGSSVTLYSNNLDRWDSA